VVMPEGWPDDSEDDDSVEVEDSEDDAEEDDSEEDDVEVADVSLVVVKTPIGPFSVVIDAAAEVADSYAELAAEGSDSLSRRTVSMIWITPLSIRTSGRTIFALMPVDPTIKVPEELVMNCRGSPAAVVAFGELLF